MIACRPGRLNLSARREDSTDGEFSERAVVKNLLAGLSISLLVLGCGDLKTPTAPGERPQPREHRITVANFQFSPSQLEVAVGDRVIWQNAGGFHNLRADDGSFRCAEGCDREGGDGDPSATLWSSTRTFSNAGSLRYFCEVHGGPGGSGMAGMILVRAGS